MNYRSTALGQFFCHTYHLGTRCKKAALLAADMFQLDKLYKRLAQTNALQCCQNNPKGSPLPYIAVRQIDTHICQVDTMSNSFDLKDSDAFPLDIWRRKCLKTMSNRLCRTFPSDKGAQCIWMPPRQPHIDHSHTNDTHPALSDSGTGLLDKNGTLFDLELCLQGHQTFLGRMESRRKLFSQASPEIGQPSILGRRSWHTAPDNIL